MDENHIARGAGVAAVLGGAALILYACLQNLQPTGCIGDACTTHPMRPQAAHITAVYAIGGVLLLASVLGFGLLLRERGTLGRTGLTGCALVIGGIGLLVAGGLVALLFSRLSENAMPAFVVPGFGAVVLGVLLVAVAVLRSGTLPTWSVVLVAATLAVLVFYNEENWRVLLLIPFAAAWGLAGVLLLRQAAPRSDRDRNRAVREPVQGA